MTDAPVPRTSIAESLHIASVETRGVMVPLNFTLGTSAAIVREAPLLLVDLHTDGGITGRTYLFCYRPSGAAAISAILHEAVASIAGEPVAPVDLYSTFNKRYSLFGVTGAVRMALSALDMALWDALAMSRDEPLAVTLGGEVRPHRAYNSCGLGLMDTPEAVADEAEILLERGFGGVKLRLGYATLEADIAAVRAVRNRVGSDIAIPCDYNQTLDFDEALRRGRALQDEGLHWLEEPIRHDDYRGSAKLRATLDWPVQIGENFNGPEAMDAAIAAGACDLVMPDIDRIGGVTGWLLASRIAEMHRLPMSSHLFPEISVHAMATTPTADWIEYVDWADAFLVEPLRIENGLAHPISGPGVGWRWDDDKLAGLTQL